MLDYPVFVASASSSRFPCRKNTRLWLFAFDFLRWTVACTLLWPSIEKFVYPGWVASIAIAHPD